MTIALGKIEQVTRYQNEGYAYKSADSNFNDSFQSTGGRFRTGTEIVAATPQEATHIKLPVACRERGSSSEWIEIPLSLLDWVRSFDWTEYPVQWHPSWYEADNINPEQIPELFARVVKSAASEWPYYAPFSSVQGEPIYCEDLEEAFDEAGYIIYRKIP